MSNVELTSSTLLPVDGTSDLFGVQGIVRILGISGQITVQADDPYVITLRTGSIVVLSGKGIGGQPAERVISDNLSDGAGPLMGGGIVAYDGATIEVEGVGDPGAGEARWLVIYEPLEPSAKIIVT